MEKKYSVSSTNVVDGKTTNITIKTESEGLMRKMLGLSAKEENKESKNTSNVKHSSLAYKEKKSSKSSTTKKLKETFKLITEPKQQLKQVKPKKLESVKKQTKVLPTPKINKTKSVKTVETKSRNLKEYVYCDISDDRRRIVFYAYSKKEADMLCKKFENKIGFNFKLLSSKKTNYKKDDIIQKQLEKIDDKEVIDRFKRTYEKHFPYKK